MDMTSVFAEIIKSTPQDDGSLLVYGKATGSDLDLDQQRCDPEWLRTAMPEWLKIGNIREQHDSKRAVGKAFEHEVTDDGSHMIRARVVDPIAKAKVEAGILTGFSIGIRAPRISKSADAKNGTIVGGQVVEVSLVDRPCLPTATLMVCKAATVGWEGSPLDLDEDLGLVKCEELTIEGGEGGDGIVEKTTDVDHLEAPAPGQICADCNEDGHLTCGEKAADVEVLAEDVEKTADVDVEVPADAEGVAPADAEKATDAEPVEPEFDREAAIALVKSAADGLGQDESGDISGADQAIALIAQLVISEAQDLAKMPSQGCDIHLLMSAVDALRCFSHREQIEQAGTDPDMALLAAESDVEKAETLVEKVDAVEPETGELEIAEPADEATKTVEPEAAKATVFDEDGLLKALEGDLEKADSPLHKLFKAFVETQATVLVEALAKSTAEAHEELCAQVEQVKSMATPGGPALRRTDAEVKRSRQQDLELMALAEERKALSPNLDRDVRDGYLAKAAGFRAQAHAI